MEQRYINSKYKTACYCRLSKDDPNDGTSVSIETQMKVLEDYCRNNGFEISDFYCDDGWTGTNFDRPSMKRMMNDIGEGKINAVIVKDLSRFGREHIMVDYYTQVYFPENNVRFIAVLDGTDISQHTISNYDMLMPIKSVFNEFFPADTSMKVRQAFATKAKHGEFIGSKVPYGYKKSPEDKHVLIVDEETAPIVKRIFEMAAYEGMGFQKISFRLFDDKVLTPSALEDMRNNKVHKGNPYQWNLGTVKSLINNRIYIGTLVSGKRKKLSFKSKKVIKNDESEWIVVENVCEPIVSRQLWDDAQKRVCDRKVTKQDRPKNIFAGLLKCGECGYAMRISSSKERSPFFACGGYRKVKRGQERCTCHFITYDTVYREVLNDLKCVINALNRDEEKFRSELLAAHKAKGDDSRALTEKEIARLEESVETQKRKFKQLYEDKFNGLIPESMFKEMAAECDKARAEQEERLCSLKNELSEQGERKREAEDFIELAAQYKNISELDEVVLNKLIDKIAVYEDHAEGRRQIKIKIYYKFIGDCRL